MESCWLALIGADKVKFLFFEQAQVLLNTVCSMEVFQLDTLPLYYGLLIEHVTECKGSIAKLESQVSMM